MENLLETVRAALTTQDPAIRRAGWLAAQQLAATLAPPPMTPAPIAASAAPLHLHGAIPEEATEAGRVIAAPAGPPPPAAPGAPHAHDAPPPAAIDPALLGQILGSLRALPPEQLLDLAIQRLRVALPPSAAPAAPAPPALRFQLVPVPTVQGPRK